MEVQKKLVFIKIIHTLIWIFFNGVLIFMFYEAVSGNISLYFWFGFGLILIECAVLIIFKWQCPLTIVARRYTSSKKDNFDIFLPEWIAKNNKSIYSTLFVLIMMIYIYQAYIKG